MATQPVTPDQPDASPDQAQQPAPGGSGQQANSLQVTLGKLMQVTLQLGSQNTVIQPEMQEAAAAYRKAFTKTIQSAQPQPQPQSPPGQ